jgi:tRNA G37 N-methylase TrmD
MDIMSMTSTDLDRLVAEEKKLAAIEYQNEVWADGTLEGIETEIMAEAAFVTALSELIRDNGEVSALTLLDALRDRIAAGEFSSNRILQ